MKGQLTLCQICAWQQRPEKDHTTHTCTCPEAQLNEDTCTGFLTLAGEALGYRLAEFRQIIEIAWDVLLAILDKSERLPPVPPIKKPISPDFFLLLSQADRLLAQCTEALDPVGEIAEAIEAWQDNLSTALDPRQEAAP